MHAIHLFSRGIINWSSRYMSLSLACARRAPVSALSASVNYGFPDGTSGLSDDDLLRCALVCRAFCEPALRALWADMSLPTPLWQLLAPTINDSLRRNSSPRSFDAVSSSTQTAFGVNTSRIESLDLPSDNV